MNNSINKKINNLLKILSKHKKIVIISVSLLLTIAVIILLVNNSTFAEEEKDSLNLVCPETAKPGEEIKCSIILNALTVDGIAFETHFEPSEGLTYKGFENAACNSNNCQIGDTALVMFSLNGDIKGNLLLGSIKYQLPDDASGEYTVTLTDSILGSYDENSESKEINFDDVKAVIRTESTINTLKDINLSIGNLNEKIEEDRTEYTATVDSDKVTINVVKNDENQVVEGDGEVDLHYGTNNISIKVTSESGSERIYTLAIYRPYKFTSENYTYNAEDNYLYTKADTTNERIISNLTLPTDLTAKITDNKLIISYGTEKLLEITIINISSSKYTIVDNKIYIGKNISYDDFSNSISLNGVTIKVFNNAEEVTEGLIKSDYKLNVYRGDKLLEEYTLVEDYLVFNKDLNIDDTNKIIKRLLINTTYEELIDKISTNGTINIMDKDKKKIENTEKLKTGDIVEIKLSTTTYKYTISVLGDITGTGTITVGDVGILYRNLKGKEQLEEYKLAAGDVINDGSIKINDVSRLYRYYKGKVETLEVQK